MCGIVGYIGHRPAQPILLTALARLEYRGYDSCGIVLHNRSLHLTKCVGRVSDLSKLLSGSRATSGIAHTRWATHGGVTTTNAHPHMDCKGQIAVVHNGIIENYSALRDALVKEGHRFNSETDTEVIPHLIEDYYDGNLEEAVKRALERIIGSYAIIVAAAGSHELVCARRDSPLVLGVGDQENFIASDVSALLEHTDRAIYLEDGDICTLTEGEVHVTNDGSEVNRATTIVPWTAEQVQKGGYEHFMLKEIHEQPRAVSETLAGRISSVGPSPSLGFEVPPNIRNLVFTACGSSYHAALVGEYLISKYALVSSRAVMASEFEQVEATLTDEDWVIAITQSGETADTLRAVKKAKAKGCKTLAIVNVQGSTATRLCDQSFFVRAGPEVSVAATKTFVAQMVSMYLLLLALGVRDHEIERTLTSELKLMPAKISQMLDHETEISGIADILAQYPSAFFVARGINYPIAMEGALKTKEVSYLHAEAQAAGELKHGPFALLGEKMPVVALAPLDETHSLMQTSIKEIKARGSPLIVLVDENDEDTGQFADYSVRIPHVQPLLVPMMNTIALQLLAYYVAHNRGCPIDRPLNLAKSVTVL
ncbi:MAG: glutamine--fructose-6-phosphate transaminase (isomerizing) [Dehalococcoidia bacterium]|nr:glutamine--fructose-6-phosphate transaminase (isomerizing) [Dehalococcoidia bacterium]